MTIDQQTQTWQKLLNDASEQHGKALERIANAKKQLTHLVDHWDEYSHNRLRNEIVSVIEEIL